MVTFEELLNNNKKFVYVEYDNKIYPKCEIKCVGNIVYLMNNDYPNWDCHKDSRYKYSIIVDNQNWLDEYPKKLVFLNNVYELW